MRMTIECMHNIQELRLENERLRGQRDRWRHIAESKQLTIDRIRVRLKELEKENNILRHENAELGDDVDVMIQAIEDLHDPTVEDMILDLERENDALKKLVNRLGARTS